MLDELTLAKFDKLQAIVDIRWQCHTDEHKQLAIALIKAEEAVNTRLAGMNEFRNQLSLQATTFLTRDAAAEKERAIVLMADAGEKRLATLERWQTGVETKFWAMGAGVTFVTVVLNILSRYLFH